MRTCVRCSKSSGDLHIGYDCHVAVSRPAPEPWCSRLANVGDLPQDLGAIDKEKLTACIQACFECAQTCTACADAPLGEDTVAEFTKCIRSNEDGADTCIATGKALSRHSPVIPAMTPTSPVRPLRHAPRLARPAATNAASIRTCTTIARFAPTRASKSARISSRRWASRYDVDLADAGQRVFVAWQLEPMQSSNSDRAAWRRSHA